MILDTYNTTKKGSVVFFIFILFSAIFLLYEIISALPFIVNFFGSVLMLGSFIIFNIKSNNKVPYIYGRFLYYMLGVPYFIFLIYLFRGINIYYMFIFFYTILLITPFILLIMVYSIKNYYRQKIPMHFINHFRLIIN